MQEGPWPQRTARLNIRPATCEDADATWAYQRLPEVARWMSHDATDWQTYRTRFTAESTLATTLIIEHDGVVIGDLLFDVGDGWAQEDARGAARGSQAEIGWCLNPAHQGAGFATEAVRALISTSFTKLGIRRLVAKCFAANEPSWRLMQRLGMRRETHTIRSALHRSGAWLDAYSYALLADE